MELKRIRPPRFWASILNWLLADDWGTPAGDFEEMFNQLADENGAKWARNWYRRQVIGLIPGRIAAKTSWSALMIASNLRLAARSIQKNPGLAALNICGLAIGLTSTILIGLYVLDEVGFDRFHENADRMARVVEKTTTVEGGEQHIGYSFGTLAHEMKAAFPEVEMATRFSGRSLVGRQTAQFGDNKFYESDYLYVEPNFLELFDFVLVGGDPTTMLDAPNKAVLTESAVRKYFGDTDPIGQILSIERDGDYTITGVLQDPPGNSHISFSMLLTLSTFDANERFAAYFDSWESSYFRTYVLLQEGTSLEALQAKLDGLVAANVDAETQAERSPYFQALTDVHFGSSHISFDENRSAADRSGIYILGAVALFILLIAAINYTNLATANSLRRAREIGVRKSIGAHRSQLVKLFLAESTLTAFVALVLGAAIAAILLPAFNELTGKSLSLAGSGNSILVPALLFVLLLVGVISGGYPALFLSRMNVAGALKGGATSSGQSGRVRRILVVAQFSLSIGLIVASLVVFNQMQFVQNAQLGFNEEHVVVVDINDGNSRANFVAMKDDLLASSAVSHVSVSSNVPGDWKNISQVEVGSSEDGSSEQITSYYLGVDSDFVPTWEMKILEGRNLSMAPADSMSVVLNETAARQLNVQVGSLLEFSDESLQSRYRGEGFNPTVVGIVEDFNFRSLHESVAPMVLGFWSNPVDVIDYFAIRMVGADLVATIEQLSAVGKKYDPRHPFEYNFIDERLQDFYQSEIRLSRMFSLATALAILIACLGLFGLAAFTTVQRTKEIGVRKALGASVTGIMVLLSKDVAQLVGIAYLLAAPVAWFMMDKWLDAFAFRTQVGTGVLLLAGGTVLVIALGTVSYQSFRAASVKPVDSLRTE